jgi:hypothetical protein
VNKSTFLSKVVSDLKFGHFYFFGSPLTSATLEVGWKTSNYIVEKYGKKGKIWLTLCEIIILSIGGARLIFISALSYQQKKECSVEQSLLGHTLL